MLILTVACISFLPVASRLIDSSIPRIEVVFFRYFFGIICLSLLSFFWLSREKTSLKDILFQTLHSFSALQVGRVLAGMISLFFLFYSAAHMPVLSLKSMTYIAPMFASLFALIFLKDKISNANKVSFLLVILGLLVYFRPWEIGFTMDLAFYSITLYAVFAGFENLFVKLLSTKYHPLAILFFVNICASFILFCVVYSQFVMPSFRNFCFLLILAVASILTQVCYLYVVKRVSLILLMSFSYTGIIFSAIYGELIFGERPAFFEIIGCCIILMSGFLTILFDLQKHIHAPVNQTN